MGNIKNVIYSLLCLSFSLEIGAGAYEHLAILPQTFSAPPASLSMYQGVYALNAAAFWSKIHPITLLLFITSFFLYRKSERRKNILIALIGYLFMLVTFIYFVPELLDIIGTKYAVTIDKELVNRGAVWLKLSWLRLITLVSLAIVLLLGLTKNGL